MIIKITMPQDDITKLKIDYGIMAQKIDDLSRTVGRIEKTLNEYITEDKKSRELFEKEFEKKCDKFDERYASKRVERRMDVIEVAIILGVIGAVLSLIFK